MSIESVNFIQEMLAPGVMISACGLLLLGMNNKYSVVVSRTRTLNDEWRKHDQNVRNGTIADFDLQRMESIKLQISKLFHRIKLIRNAVLCYSIAVGLFVLSSLSIGYQLLLKQDAFYIIFMFFFSGMLAVLAGAYFAFKEMIKTYAIVQIEIQSNQ
jgi:hypothetical protein